MSFDTATTFSRTSHGRLVRRYTPLIRHCTAPHSTASPVTPAARFPHTGRFLGRHHWGCPRARQDDRECGPSNARTVRGFSEDDHWETWGGNLLPISIGALSEEPRSRESRRLVARRLQKTSCGAAGHRRIQRVVEGEIRLLHRSLLKPEVWRQRVVLPSTERRSRRRSLPFSFGRMVADGAGEKSAGQLAGQRCRSASAASSTRFP